MLALLERKPLKNSECKAVTRLKECHAQPKIRRQPRVAVTATQIKTCNLR
jgi:hypothetical protein